MSVTVYVWNMTSLNPAGHVSMEVGGTYMSYWPETAAGKKDFKISATHPATQASRYDVDRRQERKPADWKVVLHGLDERRMVEAWTRLVQQELRYNMVKHNCSTVIATILEAGSGVPPTFEPRLDIGAQVPTAGFKWMLRVRFFSNRVTMWTPLEVQRYAIEVQRRR
jgi:hypothetical protein